MMSINGMISIRARLCGIGEATCIKLVGRPRHRVGNRDFHFRGNFSRLKSPASECAGGRVVQNRAADGLRHRRVRHIAAGRINTEYGNTAAHDVAAASFVRVIRFGSKDRHCFSARDRHRSWYPCLRRLHRTSRLGHILRWWRFFFVKLRRYFGNRGGLGNRNIFRWRRRLIFRLQCRFHCRCWNIRKIDSRRFVFNCRDAHRGQMDRNRAAESGPELPARRRSIKKRSRHGWLSS